MAKILLYIKQNGKPARNRITKCKIEETIYCSISSDKMSCINIYTGILNHIHPGREA